MNKHYMELFELSQKLSDPLQAQSDMKEAYALVAEMFKNRYIRRVSEGFKKIKESSLTDPPKEVALLRSLKPFMPEKSHESINKMTEILLTIDTLRKLQMRTALKEPAPGGKEAALLHEGDVYEVDWDCMKEKEAEETAATDI